MTSNALIVIGYYVVALAGFTAWTYADHARTRRQVSGSAGDGPAERFALRVAIVLGVVAAIGVALLLALLLDPAPAILLTLGVAVVDGLVTFGIALAVLRFWGRWFHTDLLSDLRPTPAAAPSDASDRAAPSGAHTES